MNNQKNQYGYIEYDRNLLETAALNFTLVVIPPLFISSVQILVITLMGV